MTEETKTPEQVAQDGLNRFIQAEAQKLAQQHINIVQLRIQAFQLATKFHNDEFSYKDILPIAEDILKFLASGEYDKQ